MILFAHGAGAGSNSPWMQAWAERLGRYGAVVPFDYPYVRAGRKAPDRLPRLLEAHREALRAARARFRRRPRVVLCGKSMGSRVGCHLALEEEVAGLVCLGYPLRGVGKSAPVRSEVLEALRAPILFVQGTRDRLCPLDLLAEVRARMQAPSALHVVEEGDHSLSVTKRHTRATGISQEASDARALAAIGAFLGGLP
ncbi:MAG: alpha/beta hydrolase [Planctomycetota bacterium]|nr:MAG: alpha/beta hydrolase [Planctomycetota bacterium]